MKIFLPNANSWVLKATLVALIGGLVALSTRVVLTAVHDNSFSYITVVATALQMLLAIGLWRTQAWARTTTVYFIWFMIIVSPLVVFSPFRVMDELWPNPPSAWILALQVYPWVGLGIIILHVLGKHKADFSCRAAIQPGIQPDDPASGGYSD